MLKEFKASLYFPSFTLVISSDDKNIFDLILRQFPSQCRKSKSPSFKKTIPIRLNYRRTKYSLLPRSKFDCFHRFTLFYNQYADEKSVYLDVGPRTLRTTVNPDTNTITSFIATPPDIEQDLLFDLIFFQPLKCLLESNRLFLFHASLVGKNNKGILFSGKSGSGKSIVSLKLMKEGFDYLSDDEVVLKNVKSRVECLAFPSLPKVKKKLLRFFPELKENSYISPTKKDKVLVDIHKVYPKQIKEKITPTMLIFPKYSHTSKIRIEALDKKRILKYLLREEFMYFKTSRKHVSGGRFEMLLSLLNQVKVYRLFYNDERMDEIPSVVSRLL